MSTAPSPTGGVSASRCQPRSDRAQTWAVGPLPALVTSSPRAAFPATDWVVPGGPGQAGGGRRAGGVEQARAGLGRRGDPVGGHRQLRGDRRVLRPQHVRPGGDLPGHGEVAFAGHVAPLLHGVRAGHGSDQQGDGEHGQQPPEPAGAATLGVAFGVVAGGRGVEEGAFDVVELTGRLRGELLRRGESAAAQQQVRVAAGVAPGPGGLGEPAVRGQPGAVGVDPAPQAGPGGQQRLVGDLDGVLVDGEQPARDEEVEHLADLADLGAPGQLRALHPAPRIGQVRGDVHEPQEDPPDEFLPIGGQLGEHLLRGLRHAADDAAHRVVVGNGHPHALTPPPRRQQRVRQQGQQASGTGLGPGPVHVGEQDLDQAVLDGHAGLARGFDDGGAQVGVVHRPDDHLRLLGGAGEFGVLERAAVEVGAQRDHHRRGERAQLPDERGALVLVDGRAEDLLELVDDQERGVGAGRRECGERGLARREQHRRANVRRRSEHRDDTGPQHRRLARTGGTDHHQGPPAGAVAQRRHDDVHQRGAPEEPGRVLGPEALQPAVGRLDGPRPTPAGHLAHPAQGLVPLPDDRGIVDPAGPQDRVEGVRVRAVPTGEVAAERAGDHAGRLLHLADGQACVLAGQGQLAGELPGAGDAGRVRREPLRRVGLVRHVHPP